MSVLRHTEPAKGCYIGADLGASKILAGLVTPDGKVTNKIRHAIKLGDADGWLGQLRESISILLAHRNGGDVVGIAVGIPGVVDSATGVVRWIQNLPYTPNLPLARLLSEAFGCPTVLENDVDLAALGEHRFGAGAGTREMVLVSVGTGIGAGLIVDGRLYRGASGIAGAIGWFSCDPGQPAPTLEALAAGPALAERVVSLIGRGRPSEIMARVGGSLDKVTAELVIRAAEGGDELCRQVVNKAMWHIGTALANIASLLNPEIIVLAGGVLAGNAWLLDEVRRVALERMQPLAVPVTRIVASSLGEEAALVGSISALSERGSSPEPRV